MDYSHKEKRQEEKSEIVSWIISTKRKREKEKSNIIFLNEIFFIIPTQAGVKTSSDKVTAF